MNTEIRLRASSLPLVAACSAASIAPDVRIVSRNDGPASLGNGVHHFLKNRIGGESLVSVGDIAGMYGVEADDLGPACGQAWNAWREIAASFPMPQCEVALPRVELIYPAVYRHESTEIMFEQRLVSLTGTVDVVSRPTLTLGRLLDWKSGWADYDHEEQVKGYALMLVRMWEGVEVIEAVVLNTRLGWKTVYRWTRDELEAWWKRLTDALVRRQNEYRPSATICRYCPRAYECPARRQLVQSSVMSVLRIADEEVGGIVLTPDEAADLLQRARLVEKAANDAIEIVRAEVAAAGGSLPLSDGRTLVLTDQKRRVIVAGEAWPILMEVLGERMPEAVAVSKTIAEKIVGDAAPKANKKLGHLGKGAAKKDFVKRLDEAGALETKITQRLEIKRPGTMIEHTDEESADE